MSVALGTLMGGGVVSAGSSFRIVSQRISRTSGFTHCAHGSPRLSSARVNCAALGVSRVRARRGGGTLSRVPGVGGSARRGGECPQWT